MDHKITITTDSQKLIDNILSLIKNENAAVQLVQKSEVKNKELIQIMNELAKGLPELSIEDPVAWQRGIRKDRNLPFRK